MLIEQVKNLINDAVEDALGKNSTLSDLDTSDIVSMGKAISSYDAYEGFYGSLVNRIVRTVYFVRTYEGNTRSVLRDEHDFGAFIQKVYYELPEAVDNPAFATVTVDAGTGARTYSQASPYGVTNVVSTSALIYGGQGTWSIEIMRPEEQIKTAFLDEASMMSFIDGIYIQVENSFKLEEERLVATAVNTAIASAINGGKARNLLAEYNTANPNATLTVAEALTSADFLKFASKEINDTINYMQNMSTLFNVEGYTTFTDRENLVVEMLSAFASASDMYLQADTFHNELTALPRFDRVPFWQGSGSSFAFDDVSSIDIIHDDFKVAVTNPTGEIKQGGIICFLHDIENVAAYFGDRHTWEMWNPRSRVMNHGEQARKGYAVDNNANAYVFYIEATSSSNDGGVGD